MPVLTNPIGTEASAAAAGHIHSQHAGESNSDSPHSADGEFIACLRGIEQSLSRIERGFAREPKRLLTRQAAAESLSMSIDHLEKHVQPHLRVVRSGALRLIPTAELDRWVRQNQGFAQ
jgi:hypothetical protein